ncbi:MAG TPA: hypothetical protein VNW92_23500 [Polyangiaceae bacterium]|nr:hypothetical protein [Polyangiaceae bacterium]
MSKYRRQKFERAPKWDHSLEAVKFTQTEQTKRWTHGCRALVFVAVLYAPVVYLQPKIVGAVSGVVTTGVAIWRACTKK